jgi:hypothetical protein
MSILYRETEFLAKLNKVRFWLRLRACINFTCYILLLNPEICRIRKGGSPTSRQTAVGLSLFNVAWALMFAVPPLLGWGLYLPEPCGLR